MFSRGLLRDSLRPGIKNYHQKIAFKPSHPSSQPLALVLKQLKHLQRDKSSPVNLHSCTEWIKLFERTQPPTALPTHIQQVTSLLDSRNLIGDVFFWKSVIYAYLNHGMYQRTYETFERIHKRVEVDVMGYMAVIKAVTNLRDAQKALFVYEEIGRSGLGVDVKMNNALMNMFLKCGDVEAVRSVFGKMKVRTKVSWTIAVECLNECGEYYQVIQLLEEMKAKNIEIDDTVLVCVAKAYAGLGDLEKARKFYNEIKTKNNVNLCCSLMRMFSKCGDLETTTSIFNQIEPKNIIAYTIMIENLCDHQKYQKAIDLFEEMEKSHLKLDCSAFISVSKAVIGLNDVLMASKLYTKVLESGIQLTINLLNSLIYMFSKCGDFEKAKDIWEQMKVKDISTWNIILDTLVHYGKIQEVLNLFDDIVNQSIQVNSITLVCVCKAITSLGDLERANTFYLKHIQNKDLQNLQLSSSLVIMFSKCGDLERSLSIFQHSTTKNTILYNIIIDCLSTHNKHEEAFNYYLEMRKENQKIEATTVSCVVKSLIELNDIAKAMQFYLQIKEDYVELDSIAYSSLLKLFSKLKDIQTVWKIFSEIKQKDNQIISTMINCLNEHRFYSEAFTIFEQFKNLIEMDEITLVYLTKTIIGLNNIEKAKILYHYVIISQKDKNVTVASCLILMFSKCGDINTSEQIFTNIQHKDIFLWNIMIECYAEHGKGQKSLLFLDKMMSDKIIPNSITFVSLLNGLSHVGLFDKASELYFSMKTKYNIDPSIEHQNCIVDALGRSGKLREAEEFIEFFIKQPNMQTYMALLSACRTHVDVDCAKRTAEKAFQLDINNPSIYVLLGNTFAMAGRMEDRDNIRNLMTKRGIQKVPGKTWGIIQGKEESFVANDQNHPEAPEIFQYSKELHYGIKKAGYKPNFNYVLLKDGKTKEEMMDHLCSHSERLFIAQALRKNKTGEPIIAQKNLRMCGDCHEATKFISLIKQVPIVIRDANRWHHFENGKCSCSDFF